MELPMSETNTVSPLRQRMLEDMAARKLNPHTQRSHISSCKRFAAWLKRSPDTATPDEVRLFQLHLIESEGPQGSARDAAGRGPRPVAAMVEGTAERTRRRCRAVATLAVSRSQRSSGAAADHAPVRAVFTGSTETSGAAPAPTAAHPSPP